MIFHPKGGGDCVVTGLGKPGRKGTRKTRLAGPAREATRFIGPAGELLKPSLRVYRSS